MSWKENISIAAGMTKKASYLLSALPAGEKNLFLGILAEEILCRKTEILAKNRLDVKKAVKNNLSSAFIDRLTLTPELVDKMAESVENVRNLTDPVGTILREINRPNGLVIRKVRVPIGIIGIIYESRPDVTIEASILCIKAGNCVMLRGGKEAIHSNKILVSIMKQSLCKSGIDKNVVNLITSGGRQGVRFMLSMVNDIDLIIPRGGESLIRIVTKESQIPVIKHYKGVCHTYVDKDADMELSWKVVLNAKVQRPGTCNAMETLLVHKDIALRFLPKAAEMFKESGVELRGCPETKVVLPDIKKATEKDWNEEYLDLILSVKIVESLDEAINHINKYGTKHSEAILTENSDAAEKFLTGVDAACIYHNVSTRFTDGGEFGLGAEIGISTDKIHARGPMALEELTSYKYVIYGNGQIRT